MSDTTADDDFQKELLGLFAEEAYEWLSQILAALVRLESVSQPSQAPDAVDALTRALTSLGGSAATIDLPAIQESVFALLPSAEALRTTSASDAAAALLSLRTSLDQILSAIASATGTVTTLSFEPPVANVHQATQLLEKLDALRRSCAARRQTGADRRIVALAIRQVQEDVNRRSAQPDVPALRRLLDEVQRSDAEYSEQMQGALPALAASLSVIKAALAQPSLVRDDQWVKLLEGADHLAELSRRHQAPRLIQFFVGLATCMRLVSDKRVTLTAKRLELVEGRIVAMGTLVEQWASEGAAERQDIAALLPM
ncbi:MAG: Hpt domain-containing protein [Nitrospiraceae bacterium]